MTTGRILHLIASDSARDLRSRGLWRACLAECLGSLMLLFFCCAPNVDYPMQPGSCFSVDAKVIRAGLTSGLSVAGIVWSLGHISGAHINPALTLAFLVTGKISLVRALLYIPMQCTGGVAGTMLLKLLTPFQLHNATTFGLNSYNPALMHPAQAFGMELVLTFVMILPVFACTDNLRFDQTGSISLVAGLQVSCCIFAGAVLSGSSMNPIRTLGPAVASGRYDQLWVYVTGPTCGGCLSGLTYVFLFKGRYMLAGGGGSGCGGGGGGNDVIVDVADPGDSASVGETPRKAKGREKRRRMRVSTTQTDVTSL